jgi:hypothetical protein
MKEVLVFTLSVAEVALVFVLVGMFFTKVLIPFLKN